MSTKKPRAPAPPRKRKKPAAGGRPSAYRPEFVDQAAKLCELGATDVDLADFFGVSINTIGAWKTKHPEFLGSLKAGKDAADARVERSLYQRAVGYTFDSLKVFLPRDSRKPVLVPIREHVPPDTTAQIFWLKNRRKDEWRDRQQHEHSGPDGGPIPTEDVTEMSDLEKARRLDFWLDRARRQREAAAAASKPTEAPDGGQRADENLQPEEQELAGDPPQT